MEAEAAGALAAEASSQMGGSEQTLWAVCAQLRALPELADCSDLAWYLAKKYAPAAERAGKLVPVKNKRFGELARVVALSQRELLAEFDPDAAASDESDGEDVVARACGRGSPTSSTTTTAAPRRRRCVTSPSSSR